MLRLAAVLSLTVAAALAPPAAAEDAAPQGRGCFGISGQVAGENRDGWYVAGPVIAPGSVVEITCEVVDWFTDEVVAAVSSGPQQDVAYAISHVAYPDGDYDYCTSVTVDGVSWRQTGAGTWEPGGRNCPGPTQVPPECLPLPSAARSSCDYLGYVFEKLEGLGDPVCSVLGGDVYVDDMWVWDCPPYGS